MTLTFRRTRNSQGATITTVDRWTPDISITQELLDQAEGSVLHRHPDDPSCFWIQVENGAALYKLDGPGALPHSWRAKLVCTYHERSELLMLPTTRRDGWPLCPRCGDDELASLIALGSTFTVPLFECYLGEFKCYGCAWQGSFRVPDSSWWRGVLGRGRMN